MHCSLAENPHSAPHICLLRPTPGCVLAAAIWAWIGVVTGESGCEKRVRGGPAGLTVTLGSPARFVSWAGDQPELQKSASVASRGRRLAGCVVVSSAVEGRSPR